MIPPRSEPFETTAYRGDDVSMLAFATFILRWRRLILSAGIVGLVLGAVVALVAHPVYRSTTTFIPQGSDTDRLSGLALAASQFGLNVPTSGWGPPIYVELLRSKALLQAVALDTVDVAEEKRSSPVIDLLGVTGSSPAMRLEKAVKRLREVIQADEDKRLGAVRINVDTRWPSVSLALSQLVVDGVTRFNGETRRSQAAAERQFVEQQSIEAEAQLRQAEDRLQAFSQRNRVAGSPELSLERDRLQRDVDLRQQLYTSLVQNREEARIREVRDIPVITMLEDPRLPAASEGRKLLLKMVLGFLGGVLLGMVLAVIVQGLIGVRSDGTTEAQEFFRLVEEAKPRFARKRLRRS
jgi:uncharacterized protein involved in exopolysaccharide biosynthesis